MSKTRRLWMILISTISLMFILSSCATGPDNKQTSLRPEGENAEKIMNLFSPIFWIATVIGIGVIVAVVYASLRFRKTDKNSAPKQIHGNSALEIGWTILPLVILIGVAIPTVKTVFDLDRPVATNAVKVEVTGKQWWWQFQVETDEYSLLNADGTAKLDENGRPATSTNVVTANELVVPINTDIELKINACDKETPVADKSTDELKDANPCNVIHSFWIPSLGGKADAVPGRENRLVLKATNKGIFTGQCAEYCGLSHGVMRMQVRVVDQADYDAWIDNLQKPPVESSVAQEGTTPTPAQGAIAKFGCANCHSFDDPSTVSYGPNLTHFGPDFENEVMGGGSIEKTQDRVWRWIHNATDWENGNGIPMQSDDCRLGISPGEGKRCVGMPNYSVVYKYQDENGTDAMLPAMSETEAQTIADYLYKNK